VNRGAFLVDYAMMGESHRYKNRPQLALSGLVFGNLKYANWRIYFSHKLSKLIKSALLVHKSTIGTRP
jgi:hypothetical protein